MKIGICGDDQLLAYFWNKYVNTGGGTTHLK